MPKSHLLSSFLALFFLIHSNLDAHAQGTAASVPSDIILRNARVWADSSLNSEDAWSWKQALSIRKDSVFEIGDRGNIEKNSGPETKFVDIGGRVVLPGLIDTNSNLVLGGLKKLGLSLTSTPSKDELKRALLEAQNEALIHGVTSVHTEIPAGLFENVLNVLIKLYEDKLLKIRVALWPDVDEFQKAIELSSKLKDVSSEWVKLAGFSVYIDGDLLTKKALLIEPYSNEPSGLAIQKYTQEQLNTLTLASNKAKYSMAFHAAGDRAIGMAVTAITNVRKQLFNSSVRNRIIGFDLAHPAIFDRLKAANILAIMQPTHILETPDSPLTQQVLLSHVGPARAKFIYAYRNFATHQVRFGVALDYPEYPMQPFAALYAAVTRAPLQGKSPPNWNANETLSVEQVLRAFTLGGAYASLEEHMKGSLREGKLADMVVLDADPFKQKGLALSQTSVLMTIINGQIVYNRLP